MNNNIANTNKNENDVNAIKEKYLRGNKAKLTTAKIATVLMIIAALMFSQFLDAPVTNIKPGNRVYDTDGIMSEATISAINEKNNALRVLSEKNAEIVVVVEKENSRNKNMGQRAEKLFKDYKVSDHGMLFIIAVPDRTSGAGGWLGNFFGGLFGARSYYAHYMGKEVPQSIVMLGNSLADNFNADHVVEDRNAAVLDTFDSFLGYFEEFYNISTDNHNIAFQANASSSFAGIIRIGLGAAAIFGGALILIGIFSGSKKKREVRRVYKSSSWFGKV